MKIGITGGIGSGKSFISGLFQTLGIPIYNADIKATYLMENLPELKEKIIQAFGDESYVLNKLNKIFLAQHVFNNEIKRHCMNEIVHPVVKDDFLKWGQSIEKQHYGIESAILIESGFHTLVERIILVEAPLEMKLERIQHRDLMNKEQAISRMRAQYTDDQKRIYAHFIIQNDEQHALIPQIENILSTL